MTAGMLRVTKRGTPGSDVTTLRHDICSLTLLEVHDMSTILMKRLNIKAPIAAGLALFGYVDHHILQSTH
jgi:hypothetical protein